MIDFEDPVKELHAPYLQQALVLNIGPLWKKWRHTLSETSLDSHLEVRLTMVYSFVLTFWL